MCQGSGVKHESTSMWCKATKNWFSVGAFLAGGEGKRQAPLLLFFPTIAPVRGLVLWRWVLTTPMWKVCQCPTGDMSVVTDSGWKTSGHVIFRPRSQIWPHLLQKVLMIFFLTWRVSLCITGLIRATSKEKRNWNCIKPRRVNGLTDRAWVCGGLSTPCQLLSTNRDITGYMWESITSIQECLWEIGLISQKKPANTIIASVSEA